MGFPQSLDPSTPAGSASPALGDDQIRALKQFLADLLGVPVSPDVISAALMALDLGGGATKVRFKENAAPGDPATDETYLYAKDESGTTRMAYRDSGGTETVLNMSNLIRATNLARIEVYLKTDDQPFTSTTMTNVTSLAFSVTPAADSNKAFGFVILRADSPAAADLKVNFSTPASTVMRLFSPFGGNWSTSSTWVQQGEVDPSTGPMTIGTLGSAQQWFLLGFVVYTLNNSGTIQLQAAQNVASGTSYVMNGSRILLFRGL